MGIDWLKYFDFMLPNSRAWDLAPDGPLRKYFNALSVVPQITRDFMMSTITEIFPEYTTRLHDWSVLFGSTEDYDRSELAAAWSAFGGQDPKYIQDTLRSLGVDIYVHEWWVPGSDPIQARSPIPYVDNSFVLVNDLTTIEKKYVYQFGDGTEFGNGAQFGEYDGYFLQRKKYPCPKKKEEYWAYWYVCGKTWPNYAQIPEKKLEKLIEMIFRIKPLWSRCVLRVTTYNPDESYDIQDVTYQTDPEIQDVVIATDEEVQDYS